MSGGLSADDLEAAVAAGLLDQPALDRLQAFVAERARATASADDESFRLITGFNDIFVTIGLVLFLGALSWLFGRWSPWAAAAAVAVAAWPLAEIFTRRRRMALPSIALLIAFVAGIFVASAGALSAATNATIGDRPAALIAAGLISVAAAALHWWRFHVPITVAAGFAALAAAIVATVDYADERLLADHPVAIILPLGLLAFALAMRFDMSDRMRRTRRTDIAFWLHLIAAPAIVHPVVWSLIKSTDMQTADAIMVLALFVALALVALVVDRRALMVSALVYLIYALATLFSQSRWNGTGYALAALAVGAIVLLLSVAWRPLRSALLKAMPGAVVDAVPPAA